MFRTITYLAAAIMLASSSGCGEASSGPKTDLMALGDSLTKATFDTLSATLQKAIATAGFHGAVELCHTEATGLTESFSDMQTNIRRTALRARNEANQPDSLEYVQLKKFQSMVDSGSVLSPQVVEDAFGNVHYFKP
ncbi:MAG TPA: DUF3365 domain-containing protein, partial [Phnomibacter sp.]|nr:DUF3365 domain-containing protein [Phnomibacter sp.]